MKTSYFTGNIHHSQRNEDMANKSIGMVLIPGLHLSSTSRQWWDTPLEQSQWGCSVLRPTSHTYYIPEKWKEDSFGWNVVMLLLILCNLLMITWRVCWVVSLLTLSVQLINTPHGITTSYLPLAWWLSGKESACQSRRHRFDPWSGKIPHASEQLSPSATVIGPVLWSWELQLLSPHATITEAHVP